MMILIKYFLFINFFTLIIYSQREKDLLHKNSVSKDLVQKTIFKAKNNLPLKPDVNNDDNIMKANLQTLIYSHSVSKSDNKSDDIFSIISSLKNSAFISSVDNNIQFIPLDNGFTVLNFTPRMQLNLSENITFGANHSSCMYIPVKSAKQNIGFFFIESAAVLAVDNSINYFSPFNNILNSIINFAAKSLLIVIANNTIKNNLPKIQEHRQYFYSLNIKL